MKIAIILFAIVFLILPKIGLAGDFHLIDPKATPCIDKGDCTLNDIPALLVHVSDLILGVVGALALFMFVLGGLYWVLSAGASDKVQTGKRIMTGAVIGIVIIFTSWLLIKMVEDILGVTDTYKPTNMQTTGEMSSSVSACETQYGSQGYSCQIPGNDKNCYDNLCPGGEDNKCCKLK